MTCSEVPLLSAVQYNQLFVVDNKPWDPKQTGVTVVKEASIIVMSYKTQNIKPTEEPDYENTYTNPH
jgi:hypothetical protein